MIGETLGSCSWCHEANPIENKWCATCGHEAHVARMFCSCPACRPKGRRNRMRRRTDAPAVVVYVEADGAVVERQRPSSIAVRFGENLIVGQTKVDGEQRAYSLRTLEMGAGEMEVWVRLPPPPPAPDVTLAIAGMEACAACRKLVQITPTPLVIPFHTCGRANPAPAPGECPRAADAKHMMQRQFAGELLITNCAICGALSPDSD